MVSRLTSTDDYRSIDENGYDMLGNDWVVLKEMLGNIPLQNTLTIIGLLLQGIEHGFEEIYDPLTRKVVPKDEEIPQKGVYSSAPQGALKSGRRLLVVDQYHVSLSQLNKRPEVVHFGSSLPGIPSRETYREFLNMVAASMNARHPNRELSKDFTVTIQIFKDDEQKASRMKLAKYRRDRNVQVEFAKVRAPWPDLFWGLHPLLSKEQNVYSVIFTIMTDLVDRNKAPYGGNFDIVIQAIPNKYATKALFNFMDRSGVYNDPNGATSLPSIENYPSKLEGSIYVFNGNIFPVGTGNAFDRFSRKITEFRLKLLVHSHVIGMFQIDHTRKEEYLMVILSLLKPGTRLYYVPYCLHRLNVILTTIRLPGCVEIRSREDTLNNFLKDEVVQTVFSAVRTHAYFEGHFFDPTNLDGYTLDNKVRRFCADYLDRVGYQRKTLFPLVSSVGTRNPEFRSLCSAEETFRTMVLSHDEYPFVSTPDSDKKWFLRLWKFKEDPQFRHHYFTLSALGLFDLVEDDGRTLLYLTPLGFAIFEKRQAFPTDLKKAFLTTFNTVCDRDSYNLVDPTPRGDAYILKNDHIPGSSAKTCCCSRCSKLKDFLNSVRVGELMNISHIDFLPREYVQQMIDFQTNVRDHSTDTYRNRESFYAHFSALVLRLSTSFSYYNAIPRHKIRKLSLDNLNSLMSGEALSLENKIYLLGSIVYYDVSADLYKHR
jgi:hypothetical protein